MSKDNENVPLSFPVADEPLPASTAQPFQPDQLVSCESCLRNNPPTRSNCLYCGANLPAAELNMDLQKPALRPLETWEQGYNNILEPTATGGPPESELSTAEAADLLKLEAVNVDRIMSSSLPLPVSRSASRDEALVIQRRLQKLGIQTTIVADDDLTNDNAGPTRVRALELRDDGLKAYERPGGNPIEVQWSEIPLLVIGRLTIQRVESREEKASRKENRLLDASEFYNDETIFDFYNVAGGAFRILSKSFDFSCLGQDKGLLAEENMTRLVAVFKERAANATWDDSYNSIRKALEPVWPSEKQNHSTGWRRDRPGKLSKGIVTEISNEGQFHKYSLLRHHLRQSRTKSE